MSRFTVNACNVMPQALTALFKNLFKNLFNV